MSILKSKHSGWTFEGKRTPFGGGKGAPAAPNYTAAAEATAAGNLDAARTATAANRVNQYTPYGSLEYSINPEAQWDIYGNPTWSAKQTLAPEQQQLLDYQNKTSLGLGELTGKGLGYVENMLNQPFDANKIAQIGINPGETMQDSIMRRLQPQIAQGKEALQAQLANQGVVPGTEAYNRAMTQQAQKENDLLTSAVVQGTNTGLAANQQQFGQLGYMRNEPINTLNAVRTGSQVSSPSYISNVPQQATTQGADYLGAAQMQNNAAQAASNASNASSGGMTSGLMGLAGTAMMASGF